MEWERKRLEVRRPGKTSQFSKELMGGRWRQVFIHLQH